MSGRLSLPGEWVPHERTIMFWPCRESMWGSFFAEVQDESARVANTIAEFEPVTMVAADEAGAAVARQRLHPATDIATATPGRGPPLPNNSATGSRRSTS
jgi:agmatine deiminase